MKKILFLFAIVAILSTIFTINTYAQSKFSQAILNCEPYSNTGVVKRETGTHTINITLEKKGDKCIYKEKIYQFDEKDYQQLTCNFTKNQLVYISDSMSKFYDELRPHITKEPIFEAKLTTNAEVFQNILVNPQYCQITTSKKKKK